MSAASGEPPGFEADFRVLFESAPGLYLVLDPQWRIVAATDAYLAATMTVREEIVGRYLFDVFPENPDDPASSSERNMRASLERVLTLATRDVMALARHDVRRPDTPDEFEEKYWSPTNTPVLGDDGRMRYVIHRVEDVTDYVRVIQGERSGARARDAGTGAVELGRLEAEVLSRRAETAAADRQLKEAVVELERLLEASLDPLVTIGPDGKIAKLNEATVQVTGVGREVLVGTDFSDYFTDPDRARKGYRRALAEGSITNYPLTIRRADGKLTDVLYNASVYRNSAGEVIGVFAAARDITAHKRAEAELADQRAREERHHLEVQLEQVRRLEAVGQLAGGVAHDFNNMLAVILGYTGQIIRSLRAHLAAQPVEDKVIAEAVADIEEIRAAGERAATLTRQLLTFARRDAVRPEVLDINGVLDGIASFLRRTLGEHVELRFHSDPDLWRVRADRGHIEQIVVNLAVNARDAMPTGGPLTITTANATLDEVGVQPDPAALAGRYVRLSVADSGVGMTAEVAARAFEPFFTTGDDPVRRIV